MKNLTTFQQINFYRSISSWILILLSITAIAQTDIDQKLTKLNRSVYCYCGCTRETIEVCVCGTAMQIEADFRRELEAGKSVDQIRAEYLARRGTQFDAIMKNEGINVIAYTTPMIIMIGLGVIAFFVIKKIHRPADASTITRSQISDADQKKIEAELERYRENR